MLSDTDKTLQIFCIKKDENETITHYGMLVPKALAVRLAMEYGAFEIPSDGKEPVKIEVVNSQNAAPQRKTEAPYLRSIRDKNPDNNLADLPSFSNGLNFVSEIVRYFTQRK